MIMKHWMHCPIVVTHGRLREWQIFKKRQGDHPNAETGEVCFDINCYGRAVLMPGVTTEPAAHDEEFENFFVIGGEGLVQVGRSKEAIRTGSSIALPAGLEHRLSNTGEEELELVFCRRPHSSSEAERAFGVRHWTEDRDQSVWEKQYQGHWHHIYRGPFCGDMHMGDIPPHTFSQPHNHHPEVDEIWYVRKGQGWHWAGRDYQPQSAGCAVWLDPDLLHSLMNVGEDNAEYIYISSGALKADRIRAEQSQAEAETPTDAAEILTLLERHFNDLVSAYDKTEIGIYGVYTNAERVSARIEALKKALDR